MTCALAVDDLLFRHAGGFTLDRVSLTVAPGQFAALLGPNGAGKSTLVSLLTRLYAPLSGTIAIGGHDLAAAPGMALGRLGVVFQQPTLDLDLSIDQNLRYAAALHGISGMEARLRAPEMLAAVGLAEPLSMRARSLSGGNRRKLELARALLHRPRVLLCDEATVGLDLSSRRGLIGHIRALCRDQGLAVLWATHLMDEVEPDDPVVLVQSGRVRAAASAAELVRQAGGDHLEAAFTQLTGP